MQAFHKAYHIFSSLASLCLIQIFLCLFVRGVCWTLEILSIDVYKHSPSIAVCVQVAQRARRFLFGRHQSGRDSKEKSEEPLPKAGAAQKMARQATRLQGHLSQDPSKLG